MINTPLEDLRKAQQQILPFIRQTPLLKFSSADCRSNFGLDLKSLYIKVESVQVSGSFKARGAFNLVLSKTPEEIAPGLTAVSAGNHAIAVAYVAQQLKIPAKVVMIQTANPARIQKAKMYGAEVILAPDGASGFEMVHNLQASENLCFVHPFDTPQTIMGVSTLVLESAEELQRSQMAEPEVIIVPTGGGGLLSGVTLGTKRMWKDAQVYGVNPQAARAMYDSFRAGAMQPNTGVSLIADSLCPPMIGKNCWDICRENVKEILLVEDASIREAMAFYYSEFKWIVEGAAASSLAALKVHIEKFRNKRVMLLLCGSNIDIDKFKSQLPE